MPVPATLPPRTTAAGRAAGVEEVRAARRLEPPSWKDVRLVVGLLLVLLSVAGGLRLVTSLDDTTPVYAAATDLLPGQPVRAGDLVPVSVRLGDAAGAYVDGDAPIEPGTHLLRPVEAGELVPASALGTARQALDKTVSVPVDAVAARSLVQGSVVDVWVSRRDEDAVGEAYLDPELLLAGAVLDQVPAESTGLGAGLGRTAVQVVVPADRVASLIAAVDQDARLTLVPAPRAVPQEGR